MHESAADRNFRVLRSRFFCNDLSAVKLAPFASRVRVAADGEFQRTHVSGDEYVRVWPVRVRPEVNAIAVRFRGGTEAAVLFLDQLNRAIACSATKIAQAYPDEVNAAGCGGTDGDRDNLYFGRKRGVGPLQLLLNVPAFRIIAIGFVDPSGDFLCKPAAESFGRIAG
jgi:hypothetical protein